jgi:DNA modification methylase
MNCVIVGDVRQSLRELRALDVRVQCCVTSPPYFGLRDYGHPGQIGLEKTPAEYVAAMVDVFRLVRDVLADDGVLWLNLGDSYNAQPGQRKTTDKAGDKQRTNAGSPGVGSRNVVGLKPKDLIGIPWRVAFALQADGWYLRQDIIWHKPNPMPESVRDRCTKAHEYLFMLTKNARYYWDADAMKVPSTEEDRPQRKRARAIAQGAGLTKEHFEAIRACGATDTGKSQSTQTGYLKNSEKAQALADDAKAVLGGYYREFTFSDTKNRRSVWTVPPKPYKGAHFAVMPPALVEPCVLSSSRPGDIVLDPFFGSGTTGSVAVQHGRQYLGCELNSEYRPLWEARIADALT